MGASDSEYYRGTWGTVMEDHSEQQQGLRADGQTVHANDIRRSRSIVGGSILVFTIVVLAVALFGAPAKADRVRVIDGDTFLIGTDRIRLHGIDAPALGALCSVEARDALRELLAQGYHCALPPSGRNRDRYGQLVRQCWSRGRDVGRELVELGWAIDYARFSDGEYQDEQASAEESRRGMWGGQCQ